MVSSINLSGGLDSAFLEIGTEGEFVEAIDTTNPMAGFGARLIPLRDLDLNPGPYCMSFGFASETLARSMGAVGLINTPLLTKEGRGEWIIVSGYRRIHAARMLHWEEIPCRDITHGDFSPLELLLSNLHDNLGTRSFNDVEKGMILSRLADHLSREEIVTRYMPLLGLPSHPHLLETLIRTTQEFPEEMLKAVATGVLPIPSCRHLLDMGSEDRLVVSQTLSRVRFNRNQQQEFVEMAADMARNSDGSLSRFLSQDAVRNLWEDRRLNDPQKSSALIRLLRQEKFPLLTRAQRRFDRVVAGLELPKGVHIRHDPGFESPFYLLEIPFKSGEELLQTLGGLVRIRGWEKLADPWEEV